MEKLHPDLARVLIATENIQTRVRELAQQISNDYKKVQTVYIIGILKGAFIFNDGDPAEFFYVAQKGLIKLHKGSSSGKNVTFKIATLGDTLNAAALSLKSHFLSAQAMTDATVLRIPRKGFWAFEAKHPGIAANILRLGK